jgi:signal transduction histidine kinase
MEQVREVSHRLAPCPAFRVGIRRALEKLIAERQAEFHGGTIQLKYSAGGKLEPELGAHLYDAIACVVDEAMVRPGSSKIRISVTGNGHQVTARIENNGRKARQTNGTIPRLLAQEAGFVFSQTTRQGTIVLIRHGIPRTARG